MRRLPARPVVSFCLATFNRGRVLLECLDKTLAAARAALGEKHFNIQIVDNASTDGTAELLKAWAAGNSQIKIHRLPKNCGPVAKNVALCENRADIVVLLDDDAYPLPGAVAQMVRHMQDDPQLGAAVFDVTLPDGRKEASAYPDVFIGAGTALRGTALREVAAAARHRRGRGYLPADFFMQAEEYDLSFRLLEAGWSVQRFWDMPLRHLKAPGARVGTRTTRLDVRNNLWLLARHLPAPLCQELAADWLARYWRMAVQRDAADGASGGGGGERGVAGKNTATHRAAFLRGAAEGLLHWRAQRGTPHLSPATIEQIFKFNAVRQRLARKQEQFGLRRIVLGDWGKNLLAFYHAARTLDLEILGVLDGNLAGPGVEYRTLRVVAEAEFRRNFENRADAVILTQMSRVHAQRRAGELRRTLAIQVIDLFDPAPVARQAALQPG